MYTVKAYRIQLKRLHIQNMDMQTLINAKMKCSGAQKLYFLHINLMGNCSDEGRTISR